MAKMGRPRAQIDQKQFENLCKIQCTKLEICAWFGVTDKTIDRWCKDSYKRTFSEVYAEKREGGKISLRRMQWQLAEKNASLSIWLGKQYLGQRDPDRVINANASGQEDGVQIINDIKGEEDG